MHAITLRVAAARMRILTLCGSLRARSLHRSLLRAYARLAPAGLQIEHYERTGDLPHFNPDLDGATVPEPVAELRRRIAGADALVLSTPEYAHGLPGSLKNALDWLVSDPAFAGKPVAILHVSHGSGRAADSLREVLRTMSARMLEAASVNLPLNSGRLDEADLLAREDIRTPLARSIDALSRELEQRPDRPT